MPTFGLRRTYKEQQELYKKWKGIPIEESKTLTPREKARRVIELVREKQK